MAAAAFRTRDKVAWKTVKRSGVGTVKELKTSTKGVQYVVKIAGSDESLTLRAAQLTKIKR